MGKRKGRCVKKNAVSKESQEPEHLVKAPHSFVIHRGNCSKQLMDLAKDFRKIMEPFTATQLKERKNNTIKDFLSVSGYLHVSHLVMFTETELGSYMRLSRLPRGPTLTFRLDQFSLSRDVVSSLRKQYVIMKAFQSAPLIVLNSFSGEGMHMKLMANMFQNMFPTINITTVKLRNIRRCVLMNYNPASKLVELRHYVIRATPVGLNRGTKKVVQGKVPNLARCKDMSEFFDKAGLLSESEFDDDPNAQVVLPQSLASRGAAAESKSALRLVELGPRMTFQLMKVEDGLMDGEVLFHELVEKTEEEKEMIKKKREQKKKQKEKRKATQEENVKRKKEQQEHLKQKSMEGIKKKKEVTESQRLMELAAAESQNAADIEDDNDADYYRSEVGQEPEPDLFGENQSRKRKLNEDAPRGFKKMRLDKKLKQKFQRRNEGQSSKPYDKSQGKSGYKGRNDMGPDRRGQSKGRNDRGHDKGQGRGRNDRGQDRKGQGKKVFGSKINKFNKNKSGPSKGNKGRGKNKK